jgi:hypothetical protein
VAEDRALDREVGDIAQIIGASGCQLHADQIVLASNINTLRVDRGLQAAPLDLRIALAAIRPIQNVELP